MDHIRVERVAQSVADVVDRHDGDEDHRAGEESQPGGGEDLILRRGEDTAPGGRRRLDSEAEITQTGLGDDCGRHLQSPAHKNRPGAVGQDVPHDQSERTSAQRFRGGDKFLFAQDQEKSAHEAGGPHPREGGDDDDYNEDAVLQNEQLLLAQKRAEDDKHEDGGKGQKGVCDAHQNGIDPAAEESAQRADSDSEGDRKQGGE